MQTLYKEKSPPRTNLKGSEDRFPTGPKKPADKDDSPGPTSYEVEKSYGFANTFRGKEIFGKMKRVSFVEQTSRESLSPGPAKHSHSIKLLDKISLSPIASSRKRL